MRGILTVGLAVLLSAGAAVPQDDADQPLPYRCLYEGEVSRVERPTSTDNRWLDGRIKSESYFLKTLFKLDAKIVLLGDSAPRDAFVRYNKSGKAIIYFSKAWFVKTCVTQKEHRTARVAYILAHQYAHAVQAKRKCNLPEISRERHADMLAGWYLGRRSIATLKATRR